MKTRVSILLCVLLASGVAFAVDSAGVRKALKPYVDRLEIPGYVSVLIDGEREEWVADGWSDVATKRPVTKDSLFRICSQTKGIVGAAAAKLIVEGKLSLDDPVSKYLPEFAKLERVVETNGTKTLVPVKTACRTRAGSRSRRASRRRWAGRARRSAWPPPPVPRRRSSSSRAHPGSIRTRALTSPVPSSRS